MSGFFDDIVTAWDTPSLYLNIDRAINFIVILILGMLISTPLQLGGDILTVMIAQLNITLLLIFAIVTFAASILGKDKSYASIGQPKNFLYGYGIGALFGLLIFALQVQNNSAAGIFEITGFSILNGVLVALIYPYVEEKIFGGVFPFILKSANVDSRVIILMVCLGFGIYHVASFGFNIGVIVYYSILRFVYMYGNAQFKTLGFSYGVHSTNNILTVIFKAFGF